MSFEQQQLQGEAERHHQLYPRQTTMTLNQAYSVCMENIETSPNLGYEEVDAFGFDNEQQRPRNDPIYEEMDDDPPGNVVHSMEDDPPHNTVQLMENDPPGNTVQLMEDEPPGNLVHLMEDDPPRNIVHRQSSLPPEQDDVTASEITFNPAYDALDQQEQIVASCERMHAQTINVESEERTGTIL